MNRAFVRTSILLLAAAWTLGPAVAGDGETREISDRWGLSVGFTNLDSSTNFFAGSILGAVINVEDVLDYSNSDDTWSISGFYRFNAKKKGKHSIRFGYFQSDRSSSGTIVGDSPILDQDFTGDFASSYKTQAFETLYQLSLTRTEQAEAGILAGLSWLGYDLALSLDLDDGMGNTSVAAESADVFAPIPTLGVFLRYAVMKQLIFDFAVNALDLTIQDIDGRVLNMNSRLTYFFGDHFGIAVGLGSSDVNITENKDSKIIAFDYTVNAATFAFTVVY